MMSFVNIMTIWRAYINTDTTPKAMRLTQTHNYTS